MALSKSTFSEFPRFGLLILMAVSLGGGRLSFGGRSLESGGSIIRVQGHFMASVLRYSGLDLG